MVAQFRGEILRLGAELKAAKERETVVLAENTELRKRVDLLTEEIRETTGRF